MKLLSGFSYLHSTKPLVNILRGNRLLKKTTPVCFMTQKPFKMWFFWLTSMPTPNPTLFQFFNTGQCDFHLPFFKWLILARAFFSILKALNSGVFYLLSKMYSSCICQSSIQAPMTERYRQAQNIFDYVAASSVPCLMGLFEHLLIKVRDKNWFIRSEAFATCFSKSVRNWTPFWRRLTLYSYSKAF